MLFKTRHYDQLGIIKALIAWLALLAVLALAIWLRWYYINIIPRGDYLAWAKTRYLGTIAQTYLQWAVAISQQQVITGPTSPPGYVTFIVLMKVFGVDSITQLRFIQAVIDSTAVIPLYLLLRWLGTVRWVAVATGFIYAIFPAWAIGSGLIFPDWITSFLILWTLVLLAYTSSYRYYASMLAAFFGGVCIAIGTLFSPDFIVWLVPFIIWIILTARVWSKLLCLITLSLGILLVKFSWEYYGYLLHSHWISVTYIKQYYAQWQRYPEKVFNVILVRWKRLIFTSARIPGNKLYFHALVTTLQHYGIFIYIAMIIAYRKNAKVLALVSLPFVYGMLIVAFSFHQQFLHTRDIILTYLLASGMCLHWFKQYADEVPTKTNIMTFRIIVAILALYLLYATVKILLASMLLIR